MVWLNGWHAWMVFMGLNFFFFEVRCLQNDYVVSVCMARIFDNFAMFGYMKKNWKESIKKKRYWKERERKRILCFF